jgi:hypothetical protein
MIDVVGVTTGKSQAVRSAHLCKLFEFACGRGDAPAD